MESRNNELFAKYFNSTLYGLLRYKQVDKFYNLRYLTINNEGCVKPYYTLFR